MRKIVRTVAFTLIWLLASPTLRLPDRAWLEGGIAPAAAETASQKKPVEDKKKVRQPVHGSAPIPPSVAPGLYPMQPTTPPKLPDLTGTVTAAPPVAGYPQVPTVPIVPQGPTGGAGPETSQDRIARCTHQGALGGLPPDQLGPYVHACAMQ